MRISITLLRRVCLVCGGTATCTEPYGKCGRKRMKEEKISYLERHKEKRNKCVRISSTDVKIAQTYLERHLLDNWSDHQTTHFKLFFPLAIGITILSMHP